MLACPLSALRFAALIALLTAATAERALANDPLVVVDPTPGSTHTSPYKIEPDGTATAGSTVQADLYWYSGPLTGYQKIKTSAAATVDANGDWTITGLGFFNAGSYYLFFVNKDSSGATIATASVFFTIN